MARRAPLLGVHSGKLLHKNAGKHEPTLLGRPYGASASLHIDAPPSEGILSEASQTLNPQP